MKIIILSVPGCPNAQVARARLAEALGGRDAAVETVEISDMAAAERWGMVGSPTILVDGADPFAGPGRTQPALACRLYPAEEGRTDGAPSVADLRVALDAPFDRLVAERWAGNCSTPGCFRSRRTG